MKNDLSRRDFFKGLGVAAAGTAAVGLVGCSDLSVLGPIGNKRAVGIPATWDYETDVVIVGYGGAGAVAAITAADAGAKVILLEKYPADTNTEVRHTPSSRYSGASCVSVNDVKAGSEHLYALSFGSTPKDVCDAWAEAAFTIIDYLRSLGLDYGDPTQGSEYPDLPGAKGIQNHLIKGEGPRQFRIFQNNIAKRSDSITVMYETPGKRLIQNLKTGEICGVVATKADGTNINIKAKKAVAMTTGGFAWDEELKINYMRGYPAWFYSNPNNNGDGIRMGQAVGAALWHMNSMQGAGIAYHKDWRKATGISQMNPRIYVNKYGKRFFYESKTPPHNAWHELCDVESKVGEYAEIPTWVIFDGTTKKPFFNVQSKGYVGDTDTLQYWSPTADELKDEDAVVSKGWMLRANTIEDLAAQIAKDPENEGKMTPDVLKKTITKFNQYCADGVDLEFGRDQASLVPLTKPPFYAVKMYPGGASTQGGLKRNGKGQVIDAFGDPIPRLYGAGENGAVWGFLYPRAGANIAENAIFGRIIGNNMAAETPWK